MNATIKQDNFGTYAHVGGWIVRPKGNQTQYTVGAIVRGRHPAGPKAMIKGIAKGTTEEIWYTCLPAYLHYAIKKHGGDNADKIYRHASFYVLVRIEQDPYYAQFTEPGWYDYLPPAKPDGPRYPTPIHKKMSDARKKCEEAYLESRA